MDYINRKQTVRAYYHWTIIFTVNEITEYIVNAIINASEELLIFSVHRDIIQIGAIMAALFDDKPLVAGINEDWEEISCQPKKPSYA